MDWWVVGAWFGLIASVAVLAALVFDFDLGPKPAGFTSTAILGAVSLFVLGSHDALPISSNRQKLLWAGLGAVVVLVFIAGIFQRFEASKAKSGNSLTVRFSTDQDSTYVGPDDEIIAERINLPLEFIYRNASGHITERAVTALKVIGERRVDGTVIPVRFFAFCELRNGLRTFRFDRVSEAIDGNTGEVIQHLSAHLLAGGSKRPEARLETPRGPWG